MNARGKQKCTKVGSKRETGELGNTSAAVTGLSTTKHPLNNSVINSLGRLRRPVPLPAQPPSFGVCPRDSETFAEIREEEACGSRSFHPPAISTLPPSLFFSSHVQLTHILLLALPLLISRPPLPNFSQ